MSERFPMDSQDPRGAVSNLVAVLRRITRIVQMIPFAYLVFYAVYLMLNITASDVVVGWLDSLITVTPTATAILLFFSRMLRLCRWHKIACIIPSSSDVGSYIDSNIFQFTQAEITVLHIVAILVTVGFLLLANRHFFYRGR